MPVKSSTPAKPKPSRSGANGQPLKSDVLTLPEAAAYLRVSADDVVRMIDAEGLPARKFGSEWRFFKTAIQQWLSQPNKRGILRHVGKIKDDPTTVKMLEDIYARRGRPETAEG
jgi:excisionase family DNA binding protein